MRMHTMAEAVGEKPLASWLEEQVAKTLAQTKATAEMIVAVLREHPERHAEARAVIDSMAQRIDDTIEAGERGRARMAEKSRRITSPDLSQDLENMGRILERTNGDLLAIRAMLYAALPAIQEGA